MIQRAVCGLPTTLSVTWYPQDSEAPVDPDGNTVTVGITHVNGSVIVPAGTAATRTGTGVYTYTLASQATPAQMVITWTCHIGAAVCTQLGYLTIITDHYASLVEIRALDGLGSATAYPTAVLVEKRNAAEFLFEIATGQYWTQQYCRDILDGDPNFRAALQSAVKDVIDYIPMKRLTLSQMYPRQLLSLTLAGTAATLINPVDGSANYLIYASGELEAQMGVPAFPRGMENVIAEYLAGADAMPTDLKDALLQYIRYLILNTNSRIPDRATAMTTEFGTFRIRQADAWDNPTGIGDIDAVLERYGGMKRIGFA